MLGCWAAYGLLKIGKGKILPSFTPKLLYPDQGASSKSIYPAAWVFSWDGCLGAVQGPGCTGVGFAHGCLLAICICSKKARRVQEGPCSRGQPVLGEGQPG